jgi:hypothetical protein
LSHVNVAAQNPAQTGYKQPTNRKEDIMKREWAVIALSLCMSGPVWADAPGKHAGADHPAEAVKGKKPANVAAKPALPPGVSTKSKKVHAGYEHPAIEGHDQHVPTAVENTPALPPGVSTKTKKVHAGQEHPAIEGHDQHVPTAVENKPALPPGATTATHKVHAGYEHPAIEGHDHPLPSATESKPALPPGVKP